MGWIGCFAILAGVRIRGHLLKWGNERIVPVRCDSGQQASPLTWLHITGGENDEALMHSAFEKPRFEFFREIVKFLKE
jgi:hypothetical protein